MHELPNGTLLSQCFHPRVAVDPNIAVLEFNRFAGQANDALHAQL